MYCGRTSYVNIGAWYEKKIKLGIIRKSERLKAAAAIDASEEVCKAYGEPKKAKKKI